MNYPNHIPVEMIVPAYNADKITVAEEKFNIIVVALTKNSGASMACSDYFTFSLLVPAENLQAFERFMKG